MGANVRALLVESVIVKRQVRGHTDARVDLVDEIARCISHGMVDVHSVVVEEFGQSVLEHVEARKIWLQLGHKYIRSLGVLGGQVVGPAVAGPHEGKAVPVEAVSRSAILDVRTSPVTDGDAIL